MCFGISGPGAEAKRGGTGPDELAHPNTLGHSYYFALILGLLVRDVARTEQLESKVDDLVAIGRVPQSYAVDAQSVLASMVVEKDSAQHGLALMRETWRGWHTWSLPLCTCMAAMLGKVRLAGEGMQLVEEALKGASESGAHWYDAELYRVRAGLRREMNLDGWLQAEEDLERAVATARAQDARYFELRAATDLARIWVESSKHQEAHTLLAPILEWFTEGLDTPDLVDARACLNAAGT
jgi:hypothetical protein